jgi:hypothetical protein
MQNDETPPELVALLRTMARAIDGMLNGRDPDSAIGFGLYVFDLTPANSGRTTVNYISNVERDDMVKAMQEWVNHNKGKDAAHDQSGFGSFN